MRPTIRDIAIKAGVSVATVSHIINKTRYVSPELIERVERIIQESGYETKVRRSRSRRFRMGKLSEIAFVAPNTHSIIYSQLISVMTERLAEEGFMLSTYLSFDDAGRENHILMELMRNRRVAGVILVPVSEDPKVYDRLFVSGFPFLCLERTIRGAGIDSIVSDNVQAINMGVKHLIKCGHENIVLLLEKRRLTTVADRRKGYIDAFQELGLAFREENIIEVDLNSELSIELLKKCFYQDNATAFLAGGNTLTLRLLKGIREMGLECPRDVSVVGYGDDSWFELVSPPLTTLKQNTEALGDLAITRMLEKINSVHVPNQTISVPVDLTIRHSTQNIARGPFGERVVYPEEITLSEDEVQQLRKSDFKVAISFHYSENEWTRLHEQAIRETLTHYNIRLLSVADAHFDPQMQKTQLEGMLMQKPDAIIAVPTDEELTSEMFKKVAASTKLMLINNMPQGLQPGDYAGWVSVNERENGQNAAKILIDHFAGQNQVKIGLLTHGTPFFATRQRDFFAEQTIAESGGELVVAARENFYNIENAYTACERLIRKNPEIQGLYITWERPALQAIKVLEAIGREDIVIVTTDLDYEISSYMAKGKMVIGLSSQRPYEQGVAVATATAKALLGTTEHRCIGVPPYTVLAGNLEKAWIQLLKTKVPTFDK